MSGCPTYGRLVGGYALGALEPDEMEEMRRHVAVCPHCGPEADRLAALPGLLDRIVPADVPPPSLPPQVEEAVLDRFARERREAGAEGASEGRRRGADRRSRSRRRWSGRFGRGRAAPSGRDPGAPPGRDPAALPGRGPGAPPGHGPAALSGRRRSLPGRRPVALAAAGLAALVLALALLLPLGGDEGGAPAYASVSLSAMGGASDAAATAELGEVPAGTRIRLRTRGLPADSEYEVWCIRADGRWVSGGTFWADRDGRTEAELTAAVRPGDYHRMVVTRRPEGAGESVRGPTVLRGALRY